MPRAIEFFVFAVAALLLLEVVRRLIARTRIEDARVRWLFASLGVPATRTEDGFEGELYGCSVTSRSRILGVLSVSVRPPGPLPNGLEIRSMLDLEAWPTFRVETGDKKLDVRVALFGDETEIVSLMNADCRRAIRRFVGWGGRARDGLLVLDFRLWPASDAALEKTATCIRQVAELGRWLEVPANVASSLRARVEADDKLGLRNRALELLLAAHPGTEDMMEAARGVIDARDDALRRTATRALGAEGAEHQLAIARSKMYSEALRARALSDLSDLVSKGWLERTVFVPRPSAGRIDPLFGLERAGVVLSREVARALGLSRDRRAEPKLIHLLHHPSPTVAFCAAEGLAEVGGAAALAAMSAFRTSDIRVAERVARTRARLLAAHREAAGGVALTSAEGGEVSYADPG